MPCDWVTAVSARAADKRNLRSSLPQRCELRTAVAPSRERMLNAAAAGRKCLRATVWFSWFYAFCAAGWKGWRLHQPHQLHDRQSHRVQEEAVSSPALEDVSFATCTLMLTPPFFSSCSAFKACHPQVMMFYFAAESHEDMNLWVRSQPQ